MLSKLAPVRAAGPAKAARALSSQADLSKLSPVEASEMIASKLEERERIVKDLAMLQGIAKGGQPAPGSAATGLMEIVQETLMTPSERAHLTYVNDELDKFIEEELEPAFPRWNEVEKTANYRMDAGTVNGLWSHPQENLDKLHELKEKAKERNLFNLFFPLESEPGHVQTYGQGLTNMQYLFLCEKMGGTPLLAEVCNSSAPDTGNMETIMRYGNEEQKETWGMKLLRGECRSVFSMTEPAVASSDATNISTRIVADGDDYVINGRKWWSSGAMDSRCEVSILMGKTNPDAGKHNQQSMILVPMDTPGITVHRPLSVFGYNHAPHGHAEVIYENVRVPKSNILLGEGRGFEIAQGRLGPGRIHHCMRSIGSAERALELMCRRAKSRVAFGTTLAEKGTVMKDIADSRIEIESLRLLTMQAAIMMDKVGNKEARNTIAMTKVFAPLMLTTVIDRALQVHGGMGVSQDTPLASMWASARTLRFADGPDEVHRQKIAQAELKKYQQ